MTRRFASFRDFYPFYLSEHRNATCADFVMYAQIATGELRLREPAARTKRLP